MFDIQNSFRPGALRINRKEEERVVFGLVEKKENWTLLQETAVGQQQFKFHNVER